MPTATIEDTLAQMNAIIEGAENRSLTDDEVVNYEKLEAQLAGQRKDTELRARNLAYNTPAPGLAPSAGPNKDPNADYNKAFENYLRTGRENADLMQPRNAQEAGTDTEGGFLVSPQFRQKLVEVRKAFGGLAQEVESFTTERGGDLEYPTLDDTGNEGAISAEEAAFADGDDLAFDDVNLGAFKYTSNGAGSNLPLRVSVELLQDSEFDIEGLVARALGTRIQRKQADDWVNGTGTSLPFGLLDSALTADMVLDTEATITYTNLLEMEAALDPAYWQNAQWLMSAGTWVTHIKGLEDDQGRPLVLPQAQSGIGGAVMRELLGYPVKIDQGCNAITQDGVDGGFLAFGDLREAYVIRRVSPFVLIVDPYSRKTNGQVEYVAWERADGNRQNRSAYVIGENITT